jgi:2-polyprenyl-3-methyl-5-hydroxy-6-metoxy-1,4-benzoquinol methylase
MSQAPSTDAATDSLNEISVASWEANAAFWDNHMGDEGNEFFNILERPPLEKLAAIKEGDHVLDLATGNGLVARKFASLGAVVTATDASRNLVELAERRATKEEASRMKFRLLDVTKDADFDNMIEESVKVL